MSNYNVNLTDITDTRQVNVNVTTGDKGWSAELVMVRRESDGALVALREWIGGSGEKPTPPQYVTENGFTDDIEEAVPFDIAPQTLYQSEVGKIGITEGNEIDLNTVNLEGDQTIDGNKEWTGEQTLTTLSGVGDRVVVADELGKLSADVALDDFEMVANKATDFDTIDDSLYPTTQAVADYVDDYVDNFVGDGELSVTTADGLSGSVSFSANQSGDAQLEIGVDEGYVLPTSEEWDNKADLVDGKVPSTQLPSYVDDVLEFTDFASLPAVGESGKIYVTLDDNKIYRWSGSTYVQVSESLALGETSSTAYRGDRGKIAYDHSQMVTGNPHNVTKADIGLENVENKSSATIRSEITESNIPTLPISKIENLSSELELKIEEGDLKTLNGVSLVGTGNITISDLELGETSTTAYRGDRGKEAYDYSQVGHLPLSGGTVTGQIKRNSDAVAGDDVPRLSQVVNTSGNQTGIAGNKTWTGTQTISGLSGTGTRMVTATSTGVLGTAAIPAPQTLSLGSSAGNIAISGGNSVNMISLGINDTWTHSTEKSVGLYPLQIPSGTAVSQGFPTSGSALLVKYASALSNNWVGSFYLYKPTTGQKLMFRTGSSADINTWNDLQTFASEEWVTSQNYLTKNKYLDIVQVTANRNLLATDAGKNLIIEASATITVQNSTSQAFAVGDVVDIRVALGSTLTIAASTGVTIYYDAGTLSGSGSFDITGFKRVRVVCEAEDVFSIG